MLPIGTDILVTPGDSSASLFSQEIHIPSAASYQLLDMLSWIVCEVEVNLDALYIIVEVTEEFNSILVAQVFGNSLASESEFKRKLDDWNGRLNSLEARISYVPEATQDILTQSKILLKARILWHSTRRQHLLFTCLDI